MKALVLMSDSTPEAKSGTTNSTVKAIHNEHMRGIDAEFENYIPHLIDMCKNV